ncbi:MAG: CtsR family transcriptional regulator [Streptococcaceae bacterium]|jgi:transcriptional regulator CtsR|nr:CtsR family transcriptional regulator [Streptococcaceae bacterium]
MSTQNTSDLIEAYLRQLLQEAAAQEIEIQRAELASRFDVVPSQINYVIKTRFTGAKGFEVESKRGGGGYIRIVKYHYSAQHELIEELENRLPQALTARQAGDSLQLLFDETVITEREGNLLLSALTSSEVSDSIRSRIFRAILERLDRETV